MEAVVIFPLIGVALIDAKIGLIVRIMEVLTGHYQVPEYLEPWAKTMVAQEELAESLVMNHVALPPCFQQAGLVRTENPVADWWLLLFPDGYAGWQANGNFGVEPLHVMLVQVDANPAYGQHYSNGLIRSRLCFRMHVKGAEWIGVSRMNKPEAARIVSRLITRAGCFPEEE